MSTPSTLLHSKVTARLWLYLAPLLLLLSTAACRKRAAESSYYPGEDYYYEEAAGYGGGGDGYDDYGGGDGVTAYDFEDDSMDGEILSPEGASISSRGRSKKSSLVNERREFAKDMAPEAEPAPEPAEPAAPPSVDVDTGDQPKPKPTQASKKRQVIYTATMQTSVFDIDQAVAAAEALPDRFGGWLHQRQDNMVIVRIPAEHLEEAMDVIAELGVVEYRLLQAEDVTAEYTDLESRIAVLEEMQAQLKILLAKANSVEQALEIRKALDAVTMELEVARGRMRELAKSIAFSTLILWFNQRGPATPIPSSNDPFPWVDELGVEATEYR